MHSDPEIKRHGAHGNALGFFRLVFATLVVVAHTPELIDGDRSREILTRLFGTISFGQLAVDGFFIISGYLIAGSFIQRPEIVSYFTRRIARIYPAFIVATIICLLVVSPLGGGGVPTTLRELARSLALTITLQQAQITPVFVGQPYPLLNGSAWTIAYEFRCYILVVILYRAGLFGRPPLLAGLAAILFALFMALPGPVWERIGYTYVPLTSILIGRLEDSFRLTAIFLVGSLFYVHRGRIIYSARGSVIAAAGLFAALFVPRLAELGIATLGGYLIFSAATFGGSTIFGRINNRNDVSYGVYLYAWPIEKLILWFCGPASPIIVGACTILLSYGCGWLSWHALEKPIMQVVTERRHARTTMPKPAS